MPVLLKTSAGIILLSLPVYLCGAGLITAMLRLVRGSHGHQSALRAFLLPFAILQSAPLIVFVWMLCAGYWSGNRGFGISAFQIAFFAHNVAGPVLVAGGAVAMLLPMRLLLSRSAFVPRCMPDRMRLAVFLCIALSLLSTAYEHTVVDGMTRVVREEHGIPGGSGGECRIALLADTQVDAFTGERRLNDYLDPVRRDAPDIVLFAGDIASATLDLAFPRVGIRGLASLGPRRGCFVVMGDHDCWSGWRRIDSLYRLFHVQPLLNDIARIDGDGIAIDLLGVTNVMNDPADVTRLDTLLARRRPGAFSVLLVHQLSNALAEQAERGGVNLIVAGHTHGGQIAIPILGDIARWLGLASRYVSGWYTLGRTSIYVSNGLGVSVLPLRVCATPSYGIVRLHR
jgi:uncharacterized protein